jgi:alpha-tubulin suppressor-like RCC1 family protein
VWGCDRKGQLGVASSSKVVNKPRSCSFDVLIEKVSIGERHSAMITAQGSLYMMGANHKG